MSESGSRINKLIESLNQQEGDNTALGHAVRWSMHFGEKKYLDDRARSLYDPKFSREAEEAYIQRFTREYERTDNERKPNTVLGRVIGDVITENAFTSFTKEQHGMVVDSRATLKRLVSGFGFGSGENADYDQDSIYASQNLFKYVFDGHWDGNRVVTRERFNQASIDKGGPEYLSEMGTYHLRSMVNADIAGVGRTVGRVVSELDRLSQSGQGLQRTKAVLDNTATFYGPNLPIGTSYRNTVAGIDNTGRSSLGGETGYIDRPGVLPFIQLIENAADTIVIDSFQFQNKTISDYLFDAIERKVKENPNFKVKIRLGASREEIGGKGTTGKTSYTILGPNIIEIQKFGELNARLKQAMGTQENVIEFDTQDKRYHPKLYYTDQIAAIGTANVTSPMGQSINQAGSNFETMKFVQNRIDTDEQLFSLRSSYTTLGDPRQKRDIRDTLLHRQLSQLILDKEDRNYDHRNRKFIDRRGQIGLAGDIFEHLKATVDRTHQARGADGKAGYVRINDVGSNSMNVESELSMFFVLDQTMLLQYDQTLYGKMAKGEMGEESSEIQKAISGIRTNRHTQYRKVQRKVFELLAENRAFITVDAKNYSQQVFDPIVKKLKSTERGKQILDQYGGDIRKIVGLGLGDISLPGKKDNSYGTRKQSDILAMHERLIYLFGDTEEFDESFRMQLIAMSSGNIRMASVPRQHVKSFALMKRDEDNKLTMESYYLGSSNLGPYSLAMRNAKDNMYVNEEYGMMLAIEEVNNRRAQLQGTNNLNQAPDLTYELNTFISRNITKNFQRKLHESNYSLTAEQERDEMKLSMDHFTSTWSLLGNNSIESSTFRDVNNRPLWERSVSNKQLNVLADRLTTIRETLGLNDHALSFRERPDATGTRTTSLIVSLDIGSMAGLGVGKDAPTVGGSKFQFELTVLKGATDTDPGTVLFVNQNKLISDALFVNSSGLDIPMVWGRESSKGTKPNNQSALPYTSLRNNQSMHFSSIDTASYIIGSLIGEGVNRTLLHEPKVMWERMNKTERERAMINYIASLSLGGKDGQDTKSMLMDNSDWTRQKLIEFSDALPNRFSANSGIKALENARKLGLVLNDDLSKDTDHVARSRATLLEDLRVGVVSIATESTKAGKEAAIKTSMSNLEKMIAVFPELLIDIVDKQNNPLYVKGAAKHMQDFFTMLMEPHIMTSQDRTYGGPQAAYKSIFLGANSEDVARRMRAGMNSREGTISNIGAYYRILGLEYSPTTDVFDYIYRGVANKSTNATEFVGSDFSFLAQQARGFGEGTRLELFEALGVGTIFYREEAENYLNQIRGLYTEEEYQRISSGLLDRFGQGENQLNRILNFYTGNTEKIAQLPQRLKNAMGGRPMYQMTVEAQRIYEGGAPGKGMVEMVDSYLSLNRNKLKSRLDKLRINALDIRKQGNLSDQDYYSKMDLYDSAAIEWFTEEYNIGAYFSGKIKKVLSSDQAAYVEYERQRIMQTLGIKDEEEFYKDEIAKEILRVNVLLAGLGSQRLGKMIGGSNRNGATIGIIQLTGAYTDTALANPEYGDYYDTAGNKIVSGMREGYLDYYRKGVKASMIGRTGVTHKYKTHDMVIFDQEAGQFIIRRDGERVANHAVNQSRTHDLIGNVAENQNYSANNIDGSMATIQGNAYIRRGEGSIEHLISSFDRQGGIFETNQMIRMYNVIRSMKMGGGHRIEGADSGFLGKAVLNYTSEEALIDPRTGKPLTVEEEGKVKQLNFFQYLAYQKRQAIRAGQLGGVFAVDKNITSNRISGLYNPNNIKSFFFSHGSEILRSNDNVALDELFDGRGDIRRTRMLAQKAAGAILAGFGADFLYEGDANQKTNSMILKKALLKAAGRGDLGEHYKTSATTYLLSGSEDKAAEALLKGMAMNSGTTPELLSLTAEDMLAVLTGKNAAGSNIGISEHEAFLTKIRNMVDLTATSLNSGSKGYFREYINMGDKRHIASALIVSAVDFFHQISNDKDLTKIAVDINFGDVGTVEKLRTAYGITDEMWDEYREESIALMRGMATRVSTIMGYMDLAGSQSKDPTGAHYKGKTEAQHLMRPMLAQIEEFGKTGKVSAVSSVVAGLTAAIAQNSPLQYFGIHSTEHISSVNILDPTTSIHTAGNPFFARNFLGIYSTELAPAEYQKLAKEYREITATHGVEGKQGSLAAAYASGDHQKIDEELTKLQEIERKLAYLQSEFGAYADKTTGSAYTRTVIGEMSHKRFAFSLNDISYDDQNGNGMVVVKSDPSRVVHSYLPSGTDFQVLGLQWGDFADDFVSNSKEILRGFAPGTVVSNTLNKIREAQGQGVYIEQWEAVELKKFMNAVQEQMKLLSYTIAGARIQSAQGGKNAFEGMVSTSIPTWLLHNRTNILPESLESALSGEINIGRQQALTNIEAYIEGNDPAIEEAQLYGRMQELRVQKRQVKRWDIEKKRELRRRQIEAYREDYWFEPVVKKSDPLHSLNQPIDAEFVYSSEDIGKTKLPLLPENIQSRQRLIDEYNASYVNEEWMHNDVVTLKGRYKDKYLKGLPTANIRTGSGMNILFKVSYERYKELSARKPKALPPVTPSRVSSDEEDPWKYNDVVTLKGRYKDRYLKGLPTVNIKTSSNMNILFKVSYEKYKELSSREPKALPPAIVSPSRVSSDIEDPWKYNDVVLSKNRGKTKDVIIPEVEPIEGLDENKRFNPLFKMSYRKYLQLTRLMRGHVLPGEVDPDYERNKLYNNLYNHITDVQVSPLERIELSIKRRQSNSYIVRDTRPTMSRKPKHRIYRPSRDRKLLPGAVDSNLKDPWMQPVLREVRHQEEGDIIDLLPNQYKIFDPNDTDGLYVQPLLPARRNYPLLAPAKDIWYEQEEKVNNIESEGKIYDLSPNQYKIFDPNNTDGLYVQPFLPARRNYPLLAPAKDIWYEQEVKFVNNIESEGKIYDLSPNQYTVFDPNDFSGLYSQPLLSESPQDRLPDHKGVMYGRTWQPSQPGIPYVEAELVEEVPIKPVQRVKQQALLPGTVEHSYNHKIKYHAPTDEEEYKQFVENFNQEYDRVKATYTRGKRVISKSKFLSSQQKAIIEGVSPTAVYAINRMQEVNKDLDQRLGRLDSLNGTERSAEIKSIRKQLAKQLVESTKSKPSGEGDVFTKHLAVKDSEIWLAKLYIAEHKLNPETKAKTKVIDRYQRMIRDYAAVPLMLQGFYNFKSGALAGVGLNGKISGQLREHQYDVHTLEGALNELETSQEKAIYLERKIEQITSDFKNFLLIEKTDAQSRGIDADRYDIYFREQEEDINNAINELLKIKSDLSNLTTGNDDAYFDFKSLINKMERVIVANDSRALGHNVTYRSAPVGGSDAQIFAFKALRGVAAFNRYSKHVQNMSGLMTLLLSEERNRTASYLPPVGAHTQALNDYDGDSYTTIMNYLETHSNQIAHKKNYIDKHEIKKIKLEAQLERYKKENNVIDAAKVQGQIDQENASINRLKAEITDITAIVESTRSNTAARFESSARREFANYMGVDQRVLQSYSSGGWGDRTVDADTMHMFIEFGNALFPGIRKQGRDSSRLNRGIESLVDFNMSVEKMVETLKQSSDVSIYSKVEMLMQTIDKSNEGYDVIKRIYEDKSKGIAGQLAQEMAVLAQELDKLNSNATEEEKKSTVAEWTGYHLYNRMIANKELGSLITKGSGMSVDDSIFETLTKTLGDAGGDILGKTYNSLIGTMFADSPMISLGHVLTRDTEVEASVISHLDQMRDKGLISFGGQEFYSQVGEAMTFSEGLQGYLKNIHQLLRDSIKFKGDQGMIEQLKTLSRDYSQATDPKEKSRIIHAMSKNIGPGMGLVGLVRMGTLIESDQGISSNTLSNEFDIDAENKTDNFYRIGRRLGYENRDLDNLLLSTDVDQGARLWTEMARYRTGEDMLHLVTAYRFEKHVEAGATWAGKIRSSVVNKFNSVFGNRFSTEEDVNKHLELMYLGEGETDFESSQYSRRREALGAKLGLGDDIYDYEVNTRRVIGLNQKYKDEVAKLKGEVKGETGGDALQIFDEVFTYSDKMSYKFLGEHGKGLKRFTSTERNRREIASVLGGGGTIDRFLDMDASDLEMLQTFQQLSAQGKLSEAGALTFAQMQAGLIHKLGLGKDSTTEDIIKVLYRSDRRTTNEHATNVYKQLAEIMQYDEAGLQKALENAGVAEGDRAIIRGVDRGEATPTYNTIGSLIKAGLQGTLAGTTSQFMSDYIEAWHNDNYGFGTPQSSLEFAQMVTGPMKEGESAEDYNERIDISRKAYEQRLSAAKLAASTAHGFQRVLAFEHDPNVRRGSIAGRMTSSQVNALKDHATGNSVDFLAPMALTFLGAAIGSGDVDPQATQQLLGSTISAFAYARPSFVTPTESHLWGGVNKGTVMGGALAGSIKFRQALTTNSGDAVAAMGELVAREVIIGGVNAVVAPLATEYVTKHMFGINKMALDSDKYVASKTLAGSAVGAMLSAVSGFLLSNYIIDTVKGSNKVVGGGLLEATLDSASKRIQESNAKEVEAGDDITSVNDDTGEYYTDEDIHVDTSFFSDDNSELAQELQGETTLESSDYNYGGLLSTAPTNLFR